MRLSKLICYKSNLRRSEIRKNKTKRRLNRDRHIVRLPLKEYESRTTGHDQKEKSIEIISSFSKNLLSKSYSVFVLEADIPLV